MGFTLRDYQIEGIEAGMKVMTAKSKKAIIVQPTGAGKSHIIAEVVNRMPDTSIIVLQPSKTLLKQNYSKYIKLGGRASIYCSSLKVKTKDKKMYTVINGEEKRCDEISRVTYATIGSIKKEISTLKNMGVKHVIIDEIHLQSKVGSQMRKFMKDLGITNALGLTASPVYLQGGMAGSRLVMINRSFGTMFKEIIQVTQIHELVNAKPKPYWTPLKYKIIENDESALKMNTAGSDYTEYSQKQYYKSNNLKEQVVEEVNRAKQEGRKKIIVFVPSIQEANELYGLIPNSAVVHSKLTTEESDFMLEAFSTGDIPVIINVNILATGYDNPEIDQIITTRPTSSIAIFYQQIGRGCRLHEGKKDCIITDFSGNTKRFGRVEGLTFEEIPYYGWGLFNEKDELLSDYPIMTTVKPTKQTLIEAGKREYEIKQKIIIESKESPKFWFGKHKDKSVVEVLQKDKNYLVWIAEQYQKGDWQFYGTKGDNMKKHIFQELNLPMAKQDTKTPF